MSDSDNETLNAIVVGKSVVTKSPRSASKGARPRPREPEDKQCSGCRTTQPIESFWGVQRNEGKEMRTCLSCRLKHPKTSSNLPSRPSGTGIGTGTPAAKKSVAVSPNVEPTPRNSRLTRRQTTSNSTVAPTAATAANRPSNANANAISAIPATPATTATHATPAATVNKPPIATYTVQTRAPAPRKSLAVVNPTPIPVSQNIPIAEANGDNNTDTDEEYFEHPPAAVFKPLKRQSTVPHSNSEDMDHEDAIQVSVPQPKRQRMNGISATPVVQREIELDPDAEIGDDTEEGEQLLNSNGHPVGSDLAAFATSLGRLSQLLITAGKNLDSERIGALESEIHHDWRVDEMATFVEGFLKGASANTTSRGW